jgi:hypothetical protein
MLTSVFLSLLLPLALHFCVAARRRTSNRSRSPSQKLIGRPLALIARQRSRLGLKTNFLIFEGQSEVKEATRVTLKSYPASKLEINL